MSAPEKPLREMTPAELFDEIHADSSNRSEAAHRARMGGLEALRRLQRAPVVTPAPEPASALAARLP